MSWPRREWIAAGLAVAASFAGAIALAEAPRNGPGPAANTGRTAEDGFLMDFTKGYDREVHLLSDWDMDAGWLLATFSKGNAVFDGEGMTLVSERKKTGKAIYTSAEFQRSGFYGYGRYEVVMQSAVSEGVVSSFFVHTGGYLGDPHSEVDFEFVGGTPRKVHLNHFWRGDNDPADIDLWFDASRGMHLYAFEWMPDRIVWYVDGVKIREVTHASSPVAIPTASSRVMANIWAANGGATEWVGEPNFQRVSAVYRCMSHVPQGETGPQCSDTFTPPPKR